MRRENRRIEGRAKTTTSLHTPVSLHVPSGGDDGDQDHGEEDEPHDINGIVHELKGLGSWTMPKGDGGDTHGSEGVPSEAHAHVEIVARERGLKRVRGAEIIEHRGAGGNVRGVLV